ncbi:fibronectin type III domain-containing protein [Streptomyces sp. bgisy100]|uniref:fibronectin type III domain-containing protein n=1 Tax=Streptomyces sp. bgisy100 TaxID=3413783 RepID=UPI003D74269E
MRRTAVPGPHDTPVPAGRGQRPYAGDSLMGGHRTWRRRATAAAGTALLCATGLVTAPPAAAAAPAPVPGSAPLYVSDYAGGRVLKVRADGGGQTTVPTTGLTRPTGMAADAAGNLFVSDTGNNRVVKVPGSGGGQTVLPATGLNRPIGLALDADGDVFISDSFNDRVVRLPAGGGPQTTVPTTGLSHPYGLALDTIGNLFVADFVNDRVVKVPADGGPQTTVPTNGLNQPTGLALDTAGNLFIADSGNDRVVEVPAGGGPQVTVPTTGLDVPAALATDAFGRLYIADFGNERVVKVAPGGGGQTTVPLTAPGSPAGLAIPPSPVPPTGVTAAPGAGRATVSFTPSASPSVTGYTVTARDVTAPGPGGRTARGTGSPVTVTGLTPGHRYTFTVTATNAGQATGLRSAPSPAVTIPAAAPVRTRLDAKAATALWQARPPVLSVSHLAATLTTSSGSPIAGRAVRFSTASGRQALCAAVTDNYGVARCDVTLRGRAAASDRLYRELLRHGYLAVHDASSVYRSSEDRAPVRPERGR